MERQRTPRKFAEAIELLFDDISIARVLLGEDAEPIKPEWLKSSLDKRSPIETRAKELRIELETFIIDMAAEAEELGVNDRIRLQTEARAFLVALREFKRCIPEAFE